MIEEVEFGRHFDYWEESEDKKWDEEVFASILMTRGRWGLEVADL